MQKYELKPLEQYSSALDGPLAYVWGALITHCHNESVCGLMGAWFSGLLVKPTLIFQNTISDRGNRSQIQKTLGIVPYLNDLFILLTYGSDGFIVG